MTTLGTAPGMTNIGETGATTPATETFIVVTTENIPGYVVTEVCGEAFGVTVRSRSLGSTVGSVLKSVKGGELKGLTKALAQSREEALERMIELAKELGANAVVMMRFDVSDARDLGTEVCSYGTAVKVRRA